jgi:hypothetical protein
MNKFISGLNMHVHAHTFYPYLFFKLIICSDSKSEDRYID